MNAEDKCHTYTCDPISGQVVKRKMVCDDGIRCTIDTCDAVKGCVFTRLSCNSADKCRTSTCDETRGRCVFSARKTCNDGNACTKDICNGETGECQHIAKSCNDFNPCTEDSCNKDTGRCVHKAMNCDDDNLCTRDWCDVQTGKCVNKAIRINAIDNKCVKRTCDPKKGIVEEKVVCEASADLCSTSFCDPQRGCVTRQKTCNMKDRHGNSLKCNSKTGDCVFTEPDCPPSLINDCTVSRFVQGTGCVVEQKCKAPNMCTTASCFGGNCVFAALTCDDNNACTEDSCDMETGRCNHKAKVCATEEGQVSVCNIRTGECERKKQCDVDTDCQNQGEICSKTFGCWVPPPPPPVNECVDSNETDSTSVYLEQNIV